MKKIIAILMVLCMVLSFAGCGNDKTIVVGYTIYEPMNYLDDTGELIGFDTDLAKAVFENLGYKVLFQEIVWDILLSHINLCVQQHAKTCKIQTHS